MDIDHNQAVKIGILAMLSANDGRLKKALKAGGVSVEAVIDQISLSLGSAMVEPSDSEETPYAPQVKAGDTFPYVNADGQAILMEAHTNAYDDVWHCYVALEMDPAFWPYQNLGQRVTLTEGEINKKSNIFRYEFLSLLERLGTMDADGNPPKPPKPRDPLPEGWEWWWNESGRVWLPVHEWSQMNTQGAGEAWLLEATGQMGPHEDSSKVNLAPKPKSLQPIANYSDIDECPRCNLQSKSDERGDYFRYWIGEGACYGPCKNCGWFPGLSIDEETT